MWSGSLKPVHCTIPGHIGCGTRYWKRNMNKKWTEYEHTISTWISNNIAKTINNTLYCISKRSMVKWKLPHERQGVTITVGGWPFCIRRDAWEPSDLERGDGAIMMIEYITLAGFVLQVIVVGIAIGRYAEKIDRFLRRFDDEEHNDTNKNNRR